MNHRVSKELKRYNYLFGETSTAYHEFNRKLGLSDSVSSILYAILEQGERRLLKEICHFSGLSKQTINSAIRKMEHEGLVYLEMADGKNKMVCLTEAGKSLAEQTAGRILAAEDAIFASWPREDVEQYFALTEAFMLALKEKADGLDL
ncbi:MAG: MarR family winged helix-turn-helix transcriptional regulator [Butyricicoccus sp.]|nr:MarR family winged helix-turn-helix transcriptional regulator [Butyricicoccus sp.]